MSTYIHAAHMDCLQPAKFRFYLRRAIKTIRKSKLEFDAIAFSGMSGAMFAPILAHILKKEIIMVRKRADMPERGHSSFGVEGYAAAKRYVIVDDLVSTGTTARYIHGHISQDFAPDAACVGVYCYLTDEFKKADDYRIEDIIYRESSVPKIALTDDPTVAPLGTPAGNALASLFDVGPALRGEFIEPIGSVSGRFTSVSDIPDGVDMEDVPSEPDAVNFPVSF